MKNKHIFLLLLLLPLLFFNITCNEPPDPEPEPQLPPLTHEGKNTFGCLVNGEVWLPHVDGGMGVVHKLDCEYNDSFFDLDAIISSGSQYQRISLSVFDSIIKNKMHSINNKNPGQGYYVNYSNNCDGRTDSIYTGYIKFSFLDNVNRIASGTFGFTVYSSECDSIIITDGRFDVKYN